MCKKITLKHVALQYSDINKADDFFLKILGLKLEKKFVLSNDLTNKIFGVNKKVEIAVYGNNQIKFEIFITSKINNYCFEHICIEIKDKEKLIQNCKKFGLEPLFVKKENKTLLFIKDFSNNLYEIK